MDNDRQKAMNWERLGRVYKAEGQEDWLHSHTAMPMALVMQDRVRIFFGSRCARNRPYISWIEIDPEDCNITILSRAGSPSLCPGDRGMFDDNGCYPGNLVEVDDTVRLYYMGRSNGEEPLYYMGIGLAESRDGGETFSRYSRAPILGRSDSDPWMTTTPWVMPGDPWVMYYCSGIGWAPPPAVKSYYHIKRATSDDGVKWHPDPSPVISLTPGESNIAAPTVWVEGGSFHMLYAKVEEAHGTYSLGYATSEDNDSWRRRDETLTLDAPPAGAWDSEAQCYPCVFFYKGQQYLLYSGNGLGKEGIGLARRQYA